MLTTTHNNAYAQREGFKSSIGVNANLSTVGLGGDVYWNFMPRLSVRAGYMIMKINADISFDQDDLNLNTDINYLTNSFSAGVDYQFLNFMYVTAGIGVFNFKPKAEVVPANDFEFGDITLSPETMGQATVRVTNGASVSPYLGIGFGKITPKSNVSFGFEIGAYYMGKPKISIDASGMLEPSADPEHAALLSNQLSQYRLFPVIKFSVGVKLFTFKK